MPEQGDARDRAGLTDAQIMAACVETLSQQTSAWSLGAVHTLVPTVRRLLAEAGPTWQPIETAPKDGTPILVYAPEIADDFVGYCRWETFHDGSAGWVGGSMGSRSGKSWTAFLNPTLWQPMRWPAPPERAEPEGEA